jgi:hypothetical protein
MNKIQIGLSYKCDRMAEKKERVYKRWNRPFEKFDFFLSKTLTQGVRKWLMVELAVLHLFMLYPGPPIRLTRTNDILHSNKILLLWTYITLNKTMTERWLHWICGSFQVLSACDPWNLRVIYCYYLQISKVHQTVLLTTFPILDHTCFIHSLPLFYLNNISSIFIHSYNKLRKCSPIKWSRNFSGFVLHWYDKLKIYIPKKTVNYFFLNLLWFFNPVI